MLQETTSNTAAMEEERYVKVRSRFFRVKAPRGAGSSMATRLRLLPLQEGHRLQSRHLHVQRGRRVLHRGLQAGPDGNGSTRRSTRWRGATASCACRPRSRQPARRWVTRPGGRR